MWYIPPSKPKPPPRAGTNWRRKGETLMWVLVSYDPDTHAIVLRGPGNCQSTLRCSEDELLSKFERC